MAYRRTAPLKTLQLRRGASVLPVGLAWLGLGTLLAAALVAMRPDPSMSVLASALGGFAIAALVVGPSLRARGWRQRERRIRVYRDRLELDGEGVTTRVPLARLRVEVVHSDADQLAADGPPPRLLRVSGGEEPVDLPFVTFETDDEALELAAELEELGRQQRDVVG